MNEESLYSYRMRLGRRLAQESLVDADIVFGVPDSGIPAAIGFSEVFGYTLRRRIDQKIVTSAEPSFSPPKQCANRV